MPHRRTIVITGATSGIGRAAASALAGEDTRLILIARDRAKAEATRAALMQEMPMATIEVYEADFAKLETVVSAARAIAECHDRIDVLINNAGIHAFTQRVTMDGFAEMISVNYLAPWLLTAILRNRIMHSAPSRIVTVASEASRIYTDGVDPMRDLSSTAPFTLLGSSVVYGRTKLMNIMFSLELARRLDGTKVAVNCLNPGFNVTGLGRELPLAGPLKRLLDRARIGDPRRGAGVIVRLAMDPAFATVSGVYVSVPDAMTLAPSPQARDATHRAALWSATADLLSSYVPHLPLN